MKDPNLYLHHILESIEKIESYTNQGHDIFKNSSLIQDAVVRNFEIIGEATKRIPEDVRKRASHIPWRELAGLRDVLIHQYEGINWNEIWNFAHTDLPPIKADIQKLLDSQH